MALSTKVIRKLLASSGGFCAKPDCHECNQTEQIGKRGTSLHDIQEQLDNKSVYHNDI
jgi:hypothetical protein